MEDVYQRKGNTMRTGIVAVLAAMACGSETNNVARPAHCAPEQAWNETGPAPAGMQSVLDSVNSDNAWALPTCGTISWQLAPFYCDNGRLCEGQREAVDGPPLLSVVADTNTPIWATGLIRQLGLLLGYKNGPAFDAWVNAESSNACAALQDFPCP